MGKQQTKRRRKRYQAGSAFAADVKPAGVLGFLGSNRTMAIVFATMALAMVAGGAAALFRSGALGTNDQSNPSGFVLPDDEQDGTAEPGSTPSGPRFDTAPPMTIDASKSYTATIKTDLGDIEVELLPQQAPETVNNFVFLANQGFYDGIAFHYVSSGFEAIAGDPECRAGAECDGVGDAGYDFSEGVTGDYEAGTLGMINGSQFFIALTASDQFKDFTPFGRVVSGLNVAEQLAVGTQIQDIQIQES
jgi:cyclophilin family peptidyl-prolyl cis-trans isomerase